MPCPKCAGGTAVYDARPADKPIDHFMRRRRCLGCGHRFKTAELYQDVPMKHWIDLGRVPSAERKAITAIVRRLSP